MITIGHRGARKEFTENTLSGFKNAIEQGADMIELDVQRTKDNVLVVIHDPTIDRTIKSDGPTGNINEMTLEEFKKAKSIKEGESLPTLKEVYELTRGKIKVLTEIKEAGITRELAATIDEMKVGNEVVVQSFMDLEIKEFRDYNSHTKTALLFDELYLSGKTINRYLNKCLANGAVIKAKDNLSKDVVDTLHANKKFVYAWGIEDNETLARLENLGVDGKIVVI